MADQKITALTEKTLVANNDYLPIVDEASSPVTKKAQVGNLPFGQVFNVFAYGAKGDGSTDDSTAIQAAINAAASANGCVFAPPATYIIDTQLLISTSNIQLIGSGPGTIFKQKTSSNISSVISIHGTSISQIKLANFTVDGNQSNNSSGVGILMQTPGASNSWVVLEDIIVQNCRNNGIAWNANSGSSSYYLNRVHSTGNGGSGFYAQYSSGAALTDSVFESCIADTNALNGFYLATLDTHFSNCKSYYNGSTSGSYHGFYIAGYNNYFTGCQAQDNYQSGFFLNNDGDGTYGTQNNVFINCDADSNNQASNGSYGCGWQINNTTGTLLVGCQSYVRPYASMWGQRIGVLLSGTTTGTRIIGLMGSGNASALYSDTSSGTNYPFKVTGITSILSDGVQISDGKNLVFGTSTGTKIGTVGGASGQKLAFWNSSPIVQPLLATGASHTVDDVITTLQNLGLVRQS